MRNDIAHNLLEAFFQFRRLRLSQSLIEGLSLSEVRVLFHLRKAAEAQRAGTKVSELSGMMQVTPPTVTQLISDLEARGYVERAMDRDDRRAVRVSLTEKGEVAMAKAHEAIADSFRGLVEYLGEEESRQMVDLLRKTFTYLNEAREIEPVAGTAGE